MTYAPDTLMDAREYVIEHLRVLAAAVGIVGDTGHAATGTSYHLGKDQLKASSYSIVESSRDKSGLTNAAAALDIGSFTLKPGNGTVHTLRTFSAWLVAQCKAGTADTRDIREVIYSLDGKTVKRWDRLGKRTTGDSSHTFHTHISYFRDSEKRDKTALFKRYIAEITEDDMELSDKIGNKAYANRTVGTFANDLQGFRDVVRGDVAGTKAAAYPANSPLMQVLRMPAQLSAVLAAVTALAGKDVVDEPAIVAGVLAGLTPERLGAAITAAGFTPEALAEAIPPELAQQTADALLDQIAAARATA